ncbi:hypothetical protein F2Q69_00041551 [Brassica cretica]|uniref:Uncharacterized protein n=1 Tax=Brassica cretica TaxID=69181 RepID=A0A8S9NN55_BRACR|nr:hypothetical protein F2Q69_00041551 [Brassica cretica]
MTLATDDPACSSSRRSQLQLVRVPDPQLVRDPILSPFARHDLSQFNATRSQLQLARDPNSKQSVRDSISTFSSRPSLVGGPFNPIGG